MLLGHRKELDGNFNHSYHSPLHDVISWPLAFGKFPNKVTQTKDNVNSGRHLDWTWDILSARSRHDYCI